jgi:hypothetical protein
MKSSLLKSAAVGVAIVLSLSLIQASAVSAETFRQGDQFVVAQSGTPLMRGTQTLATLSQGQRFNVLRTEGEWVGTSAMVSGNTVSGWVHQRQIATPSQYAQRRTTRRSYSYQPAPATGGYTSRSYSSPGRSYSSRGMTTNRGFIMGSTPYGPSYWRADRKIAGY